VGKALLTGLPAVGIRCHGPRLPRRARRKRQTTLSQTWRSQLVLRVWLSLPRQVKYRDSKSVRKRAPVTLLLGSNQLLDHAQLLRAEPWWDLGR
jgi:hypothetical protein